MDPTSFDQEPTEPAATTSPAHTRVGRRPITVAFRPALGQLSRIATHAASTRLAFGRVAGPGFRPHRGIERLTGATTGGGGREGRLDGRAAGRVSTGVA